MPVAKAGLLSLLGLLSLFLLAQADVQSLVDAELAFSKTTGQKGIKEGFLSYLAEDAVLFRPGPVPGRKWMIDHPPPPGLLIWQPSHAEISGSGDMGFTTGPFTFQASSSEDPSGYGQFFSIWKKRSDGSWKVVLDAGINHEKRDEQKKVTTHTGKGATVSEKERTVEQNALSSIDGAASESALAEDVIILRNLHPPIRGVESASQVFTGDCTFTRDQMRMAASADLAYVYGAYKCAAETGVYVRVWRKQDTWKIALDYRRAD